MRSPYPFALHGLCLLPVIIMLCSIQFFIGPEDAVFTFFTGVRNAHPGWTRPVEVFSNGTLFLFYPVYLFYLLRGIRNKKTEDVFFSLACVAAQILVVALLCRFVKIAVGRPRPMTGGPFAPFSFGWGYQSFPSGHTGEIVGSVTPFIWRYGRAFPCVLPLVSGILIATMAFSRLYLGMHHPTDIWGGLVFGSLSGYAAWILCKAFLTRWRNRLPRCIRTWLNITANE